MLCDDVEGVVFVLGVMEGVVVFGDDFEGCVVFFEGGDGCFEVMGVGYGVGVDHVVLGEFEVVCVDFEDVVVRWIFYVDGEGDGVG